MPASRSSSGKSFTLEIPRNSLKIAGIAFGAGLLLFGAVWLANRDKGFYKADPAATAPEHAVDLAPLPEPLAAAAGSSDMPDARPPAADEEVPKLVEAAPPPPTVDATPLPSESTPSPVNNDRPLPIAGQSPPPRYPPAALRRGDAGTVVLRVDVDATGRPYNVAVIERSGSRDLDRAATDAVRQWRFTPAMSNGQPAPGTIEVPFDFKPAQ